MREPSGQSGVQSIDGARAERETARLLQAVRRGDPEAFDRIAREHAPRLFRLAVRLCGNRDEAEDLVQDTLVRALPALTRFEGRARLSTYLVRSLTNQWKNRLRSKSRSRLVPWPERRADGPDGPSAPAEFPDDAPSAQDRMESSDRAAEVRDAVAKLEPDRRLALLLREVEDMSYEDIAAMTGVPVGTVRSRLARARRDLRALLGGRS